MPMITSSEIKNSTFDHVSFRGYNPDQVDKVLDNAAETIDSLSRENAILNEKLHALTSQVEVLRQREASLNEVMIRAQKMSDDLMAETKAKCDAMIADAEQKSSELLLSAKNLGDAKIAEYKEAIREEKLRFEKAQEEAATFIDMIVGELTAHTELIAKIKTKAHIEDFTPTPAPAPVAEPTPAPVIEEVPVAEPVSVIPEPISEPVVVEDPTPVAEEKAAVAETVDDIASKILGTAPAAAPTAGMSWDEIIGLKSAPASAPAPQKSSSDASGLKFGKEFDITIK